MICPCLLISDMVLLEPFTDMISVAMCTCNGALYIEEQILSILNQTMQVDEIVICDDQSSDDTVARILHLSDRFPDKIRLIENEERLNVSANFDKAIRLCHGDVIFLSDQDDIWHDNKVVTIMRWFDDHPNKDVVFSDAQIVDQEGELLTEKTLFDISGLDYRALKWFDNGLAPEMFLFVCRAGGLTMAMRKSFVPKFHVNKDAFRVSQGAIHDEMIALSAIGYDTLGHCDEVLMDYRLHGNNTEGLGDAVNNVFKNPNPYRAFSIDMNRYGELPDALKRRAEFINIRYRSRYKGGSKFLMNRMERKRYKSIYGEKAWRFFLWDLFDYQVHLCSRVVSKMYNRNRS